MPATLISDYAVGQDKWSQFLTTIEKQRKGFIALSLTNYDNNSLPAIASGSYVEISGALYGFSADEAINGTPTSGSTNYIYIDASDLKPYWTTTAPTWSSAKNGWYDTTETNRYIGGCYYDGTNYTGKWVYQLSGLSVNNGAGQLEGDYSIEKEVITSSDVSSVDMTGISGIIYKLYISLINSASTTSTYNLFINGETDPLNYRTQYFTAQDTTLDSGRIDGSRIASLSSANEMASEVTIMIENGMMRFIAHTNYRTPTYISIAQYYGMSEFTGLTKINSISIQGNIKAGSRFILQRIKR